MVTIVQTEKRFGHDASQRGSACARKRQTSVLDTFSLCRQCYTRCVGRSQITITQFREIRDCHKDGKSEAKKLSTSTFEQMAMVTFHKLREEGGLTVDST